MQENMPQKMVPKLQQHRTEGFEQSTSQFWGTLSKLPRKILMFA